MQGFDYEHWLRIARRVSRRPTDPADVLQDAILAAIRADRTDFSQESNRKWFTGVLKNSSAMTARTERRRRAREAIPRATDVKTSIAPSDRFLPSLPAAARRVATLVLAGMNRTEIIHALALSETAFRQRLTTIRRHWNRQAQEDMVAVVEPELDLGLIRQSLLAMVKQLGGVGTHDPDGHLVVIESPRSQSKPRRQRKIVKEHQ